MVAATTAVVATMTVVVQTTGVMVDYVELHVACFERDARVAERPTRWRDERR
jgi:hypothetical protein